MKKSKSLYEEENSSQRIHKDVNGKLLNGVWLDGKAWEKGIKIILRFRNGLLDGDIYVNGQYVRTKPAVETLDGHIEYWREGKLHRDGGLAAVSSDGLQHKEYWINGERVS